MIRSLTRSTINNEVWYQNMLVGNAAFNPGSDFLIQEQILTTTASSVTFSNIPQNYKHLQIRAVARGDAATSYGWQWLIVRLNGNAHAFTHDLRAQDSSVTANSEASQSFMFPITGANQAANIFGAGIVDILDYSSTGKNKTIRGLGGQADATRRVVTLTSSFQNSTSAVTSIVLTPQNGGNFIANSRFSLYGSE